MVDWVRPVPFIEINENLKAHEVYNFSIPKIEYLDDFTSNTAVIVDFSGIESVKEGLALAQKGFRPIPVYNGTSEQVGAIATTDNHSVVIGLIWGALELKKIDYFTGASW